MRYAFAVVTWSGARLHETLASIAHQDPSPERETLVIDNKRTGWSLSRAWNHALRQLCEAEGYDCAIVLNDDVVLREDTGVNLARALLEDQFKPGVRPGPEALLVTGRHANHGSGCTDSVDWDQLRAREPRFERGPDYSCWCASRKLLDVVGGFDEDFDVYYEDRDSHVRIQLAGYEGYAVTPYWHYLSMTKRTDAQRRQQLEGGIFAASHRRFVEKWGGEPHRETFTRPFDAASAVGGRAVAV